MKSFSPAKSARVFIPMQVMPDNLIGNILFFRKTKMEARLFFLDKVLARIFLKQKSEPIYFFNPKKLKWSVP